MGRWAGGGTGARAITSHPNQTQPNVGDVDSINHLLAALYDVISAPAHWAPDWKRIHTLFGPYVRSARRLPIPAKYLPAGK